ncbi:MAG: tetratricopeptide repeat-containing protein [Pararhizobium sp.]
MPEPLIGVSRLMRLAYRGGDVKSVWDRLMARALADPTDAPALMDLSVLLQARGEREAALSLQKNAIDMQPVFRRVYASGTGLNVAAIVTAGDMMANTPIDFLLEGSDMSLAYLYVDAETKDLPDMSGFDVAFLAIGESEANAPVLEAVDRLLAGRQPPVMNGMPERVAALTREGVSARLAGAPGLVSPKAVPAARPELLRIAEGHGTPEEHFGFGYPLVVRPAGTHAGGGMARIDAPSELSGYLARNGEGTFSLVPFVDYASPDGLYRKQRIVFIDGKPFASHMAVSEHWIVHYLSAGMAEHAWRRAEEARWMETFDADFARRHATAFAALTERLGLDYFGIDCAETPDGRLLVFEADVAMIVHDMDPEDVFPYKAPVMRRLFAAFQDALARRTRQA